MDSSYSVITGKHPSEDRTLQVGVAMSRMLFTVDGEGKLMHLEPETTTVEEMLERLAAVGTITLKEQYLSLSTSMQVCRGCVVKDDRRHYFYAEYDTLYKSMVNGIIECAKLSLAETLDPEK